MADWGSNFLNAYIGARTFREESAMRELYRRQLEKQMADEAALPQDIGAILQASQSRNTPSMGGQPVNPQDVSDLAGQNLIELQKTPGARTLPELSNQIPATSLARVMKYRPQTFHDIGLQTPQQVETADLVSQGQKEMASILTGPVPKTSEEAKSLYSKLLSSAVRTKSPLTDDLVRSGLKMFTEAPDESAGMIGAFMQGYQTNLAGHMAEPEAFYDGLSRAIKAYPNAGKHFDGLLTSAQKMRQQPEKPVVVGKDQILVSPTSGTTVAAGPTTKPKTLEDIQAEEAAKAQGRKTGEERAMAPEDVDLARRAKKAVVEWHESIVNQRAGRGPRTLENITADIKKFEEINKGLPQFTMGTPEEQADLSTRKTEVGNILRDLYSERSQLRRLPGRNGAGATQPVSNPSDVGTSREMPGRVPVPQAVPATAAAPVAPPPMVKPPVAVQTQEQKRQKAVKIMARMFPNKAYTDLTVQEKQRLAEAMSKE